MSGNLNENFRGGNFCLTNVALAEGTSANTIQIAAAAAFCINGVLYAKAITDNIAMTACDTQAADTNCLYLVSVDAAGTVTITKGDEVSTTDITNDIVGLNIPELPADNAPIGMFKIVTDAVTFTSGTTDLSASGVTDTYYNLFSLPESPFV